MEESNPEAVQHDRHELAMGIHREVVLADAEREVCRLRLVLEQQQRILTRIRTELAYALKQVQQANIATQLALEERSRVECERDVALSTRNVLLERMAQQYNAPPGSMRQCQECLGCRALILHGGPDRCGRCQ